MELPMPDPAKAGGESKTFTRLLKKAMPDAAWETFAGAETRRSLVCTTPPRQCAELLQQASASPGSPCNCIDDHRWVSFISKKTLQRLPLASGQGACEGVLRPTLVLQTLGSKVNDELGRIEQARRTSIEDKIKALLIERSAMMRRCGYVQDQLSTLETKRASVKQETRTREAAVAIAQQRLDILEKASQAVLSGLREAGQRSARPKRGRYIVISEVEGAVPCGILNDIVDSKLSMK
eukprot:jgi/Astpho2/2131/fgenesh1_pg.00039_%23_1_t